MTLELIFPVAGIFSEALGLPTGSIVNAVTYGVLGLLFLAVLIFVALIILRLVVARRKKVEEVKKEELRPLIYELLMGELPTDEVVAKLRSEVTDRDRRVLEKVLLENAKMLKGREREVITQTFEKLGYVDEDISNIQRGDKIKRAESAFHLGVMRSVRALPFLVKALSSPSPEVTFSCLNALSKIGTPEAIDAVMEYLVSYPEMETLRVAEVILERKQKFYPYLEDWLDQGEEDPARLSFIIDLMGAVKDAGAVPLLQRYLVHEDYEVRARSARALGSIGDFTACKVLVNTLGDENSEVRAEAAESLGKVQCDNAISRLRQGLSDPDLTVKMNCAIALSQLGKEGHVALEEALRAEEGDKSGVASEVLGREQIDGNKKGNENN